MELVIAVATISQVALLIVTFDEVNEYLEKRCLDEIVNSTNSRNEESAQMVLEEVRNNLKPITASKEMEAARYQRRVNRYQMIEVYDHFYSVQEKFIETHVRVAIGAFHIEIYNKEELVQRHIRIFVPGLDSLLLDHYLDQLRKKPGALWDCKVTKELLDDKALEAVWQRIFERNPLRKAQKDFIEILYLKKQYKEDDWKAGIDKALECGAYDPTAIESIIKMLLIPGTAGDEKAMKERLAHVVIPKWECNLSEYAMLSEKETSVDVSYIRPSLYSGTHNRDFSRHGNAMLNEWDGAMADQIMDEYFLEKKKEKEVATKEKAIEKQFAFAHAKLKEVTYVKGNIDLVKNEGSLKVP